MIQMIFIVFHYKNKSNLYKFVILAVIFIRIVVFFRNFLLYNS